MSDYSMPEWLDLETVPEDERADALEAWNRKMLEVRLQWENKTTGNLNKQDGINCDHCRNRGWISVLAITQRGDKTHYTTVTKPCRCRYRPSMQGGNNNG